jgi:hypothetical protein
MDDGSSSTGTDVSEATAPQNVAFDVVVEADAAPVLRVLAASARALTEATYRELRFIKTP